MLLRSILSALLGFLGGFWVGSKGMPQMLFARLSERLRKPKECPAPAHEFSPISGSCWYCGLSQEEFAENPDPSKCRHVFPMDMPGCIHCGIGYSWDLDPNYSAQEVAHFRALGWHE